MAIENYIISGNITDKNGKSVSMANIYFVSSPVSLPDISGLSDDEGNFTISVPAKGNYVLGISSDGYESKEVNIKVDKSKIIDLNIKL